MEMASPTTKSRPVESQLRGIRKKRMACDVCHGSKVRCSGGTPCSTCSRLSTDCVYSFSSVLGRPKNRRTKKTGVAREEKAAAKTTTTDQAKDATKDANDQEQAHIPDMDISGFYPAEHNYYDDIPLWESYSCLDPDQTHLLCSNVEHAHIRPEDAVTSISSEIAPASLSESNDAEYIAGLQTLSRSLSPERNAEIPQLLCDCLKRCAVVLSGLKALEMDVQFQIDAALLHIRKATATWKHVLQCNCCERGNPEEAVYMAISGVRAALRYLVAVFGNEIEKAAETSSGSLYSDPSQSLPTPQEMPPQEDYLASSKHVSSAIGRSNLGGYDMDKEEQELVVKFIALRQVREMTDVLKMLEERVNKQRTPLFWPDAALTQQPAAWSDDLFHLQPLLQGVKETAKSLQESLCNSSTAELHRYI